MEKKKDGILWEPNKLCTSIIFQILLVSQTSLLFQLDVLALSNTAE